MESDSPRSQPGTPGAGRETSSSWQNLRPRAPSDADPGIAEWLDREGNREELESLMGLLECTAAEAVVIMQLNILISKIDPDEETDWGPGANPK